MVTQGDCLSNSSDEYTRKVCEHRRSIIKLGLTDANHSLIDQIPEPKRTMHGTTSSSGL